MTDELTPDEAERLLDGHDVPTAWAVGDVVAHLRALADGEPMPVPSPALVEFVDPPPRRRGAVAAAMAVGGTVMGKVLLGGAVAAAAVGGAHAAGVVDVPFLPEVDDASTVEIDDAPPVDDGDTGPPDHANNDHNGGRGD